MKRNVKFIKKMTCMKNREVHEKKSEIRAHVSVRLVWCMRGTLC